MTHTINKFFFCFLLSVFANYLFNSIYQAQASENQLVDSLCYLNDFKPSNFPWKKSDCLNIEEVFKNHQYFEARWNETQKVLIIKKFEGGKFLEPLTYHWTNHQLEAKKDDKPSSN